MKIRILKAAMSGACLVTMLLAPKQATATLVTVDQVIYQSVAGTTVTPSLLTGTLDISVSGSTITILMKNTSVDGAFVGGVAPATMLLTGFGLQLGTGRTILSGAVTVNTGSAGVNFDVGQDANNIANQWGYANDVIDGYGNAGVLAVGNIASSVNNGGLTRFAGAPPGNIDGPGYGAISSLETEFGGSTPGVNDTIKFVLTLNGAAPSVADIDAGNVVLAFGSPESPAGVPDGGSTVALLGFAFLGLGTLRKKLSRN